MTNYTTLVGGTMECKYDIMVDTTTVMSYDVMCSNLLHSIGPPTSVACYKSLLVSGCLKQIVSIFAIHAVSAIIIFGRPLY